MMHRHDAIGFVGTDSLRSFGLFVDTTCMLDGGQTKEDLWSLSLLTYDARP
mgnify:CR=1 FL=1|jgi:hypothetical protein